MYMTPMGVIRGMRRKRDSPSPLGSSPPTPPYQKEVHDDVAEPLALQKALRTLINEHRREATPAT